MAYFDPYQQYRYAAQREQARQQEYQQKLGYAFGTANTNAATQVAHYNYATQEMKWVEPAPPIKREPTNLEWLDKRVNEMRVRL